MRVALTLLPPFLSVSLHAPMTLNHAQSDIQRRRHLLYSDSFFISNRTPGVCVCLYPVHASIRMINIPWDAYTQPLWSILFPDKLGGADENECKCRGIRYADTSVVWKMAVNIFERRRLAGEKSDLCV